MLIAKQVFLCLQLCAQMFSVIFFLYTLQYKVFSWFSMISDKSIKINQSN